MCISAAYEVVLPAVRCVVAACEVVLLVKYSSGTKSLSAPNTNTWHRVPCPHRLGGSRR